MADGYDGLIGRPAKAVAFTWQGAALQVGVARLGPCAGASRR